MSEMGVLPEIPRVPDEKQPQWHVAGRIASNAIANIFRLLSFAVVAILLPAYLARHLPRDIYNTWVLVIQMGAYVGFLEIGIQTAVSKFIAEHHASEDLHESSKVLTNAALMLCGAGALGLIVIVVLSFFLKMIMPDIPANLLGPARIGVIMYGGSLALALPSAAFAGVFLGLQRNFPVMLLQSVGKFAFASLVILSIGYHASFLSIISLASGVNLVVAVAQIILTRKAVPRIRFSPRLAQRRAAITLLKYCSVLAVWSVAMLFVAGLDTTLVAHYEFAATAAYAAAASLTSFINAVMSSLLTPMIPATSALSTQRSPEYLGTVLYRVSRYAGTISLLSSVPFLLFGFVFLNLWIGHSYAVQGIRFLWILSIANAIRQLSLPYAVMVVGLGKQKLATASPVIEGVVNLTCSILIARKYGAIGVAYGTLIGAFVGITIHGLYSMRLTQPVLTISRWKLAVEGVARPGFLALPALILTPYWIGFQPLSWRLAVGAVGGTLLIAWFVALDAPGRHALIEFIRGGRNHTAPAVS
jgi:O-antigen/teichoic acid export membrane protein